jgi:hypothetical protein
MFFLLSMAMAGDLRHTLSQRDGVSCSELGEATPELREGLLALTGVEEQPPSLPMAATSCLIERFPADPIVMATLQGWMGQKERAGQALMVVSLLGRVDATWRVPLALAAMSQEDPAWRERMRVRLKRVEGLEGLEALLAEPVVTAPK